jgi:GNAT superfamily N-acetyltransferase
MADPAMTVRPLEPADVAATSILLAAAFDDDPAYAFLFPHSHERRRGGLEDFFAGNLRTHLPYRCTYVAALGAAVVATVTMRPPSGFSISMLTMIRRGLVPFAFANGRRAVQRLLVLKAQYDAIEARIARGERHWFVHMMAVDRARQGRGLGSRLLDRVLETTIDAQATGGTPPAILTAHTERNVVFYERAGFERDGVEDVSMMGQPPYRVWRMRRWSRSPATVRPEPVSRIDESTRPS